MMMAAVLLAASCTAVDGERILMSDLAKAVPAFQTAPAEEVLGLAPAPGARRILTRGDIERLATLHAVEVPAGTQACFERATERLAEERVRDAIRQALAEGTEFELIDFTRFPVPRGEVQFSAPPPGSRQPRITLHGRVRYAPNRTYPVWARVKLVVPPREVERGDTVSVEVTSGSAVLKFDAVAETGGSRGEIIVLRNPTSKMRFSARVAERGKATLDAKNDLRAARSSGFGERGR